MSFFAFIHSRRLHFRWPRPGGRERSGTSTSGCRPAPLAPRRLERRRVLDVGAAQLLLESLSDSGDFVQAGEQAGETAAPTIDTLSINSPIDEFQTATLAGTYTNFGIQDSLQLDIDWDGDLAFDQTVSVSGGAFEVSRQFLDDSPTGTSSDTFDINVLLRDDASGAAVASTSLTINNVAPAGLFLFRLEGPVNEAEATTALLSFRDPGILDSHTIEIDWGDNGELETIDVPSGGSRIFLLSHVYSDDNPTGTSSDFNLIQVTITDDDGGQSTTDLPVLVMNVAPTIDTLSITSPIEEGQVATLTGTFSDPGINDTFELDIDWDGDNTPDQTVVVSGGEFEVSRQILDDNPTGTLVDTFDVNVRLRDDDMGVDTKSASLTVSDVSPFNIQIAPVDGIDENGIAHIEVTFEDLGGLDTHFARINWGDGSDLETIEIDPGQRSLLATHRYLDDDPTGTSSDSYLIRVGIINDDLGRNRATAEVVVQNVDPVLTVAADQTVGEGALLDLTEGRLGTFADLGTRDTHTATVNWGDGTPTEIVTVNQGDGLGTLDGSHRYADNGVYTVSVALGDDDASKIDTKTFLVDVTNVVPDLVLVADQTVDEGTVLQITNLGTFLDPAFDNPHNTLDPGNGGQTEERFFVEIDWGDTTLTNAVPATIDQAGSPGVATAGSFDGSHIYADNGLYTVTVKVSDDDGGVATRTLQIQVNNVAPDLMLNDLILEINESGTLDLPNLGTFSDPGFGNPLNLNDPTNGSEVEEVFHYTIDWGDGTDPDTFSLQGTMEFGSVVDGSVGQATTGVLDLVLEQARQHRYVDNDEDNHYTIKVTLSDDDGGSDTEELQVQVNNVNPVLELIAQEDATDVNTNGETSLTITFSDIGADQLTIWVDWGDIRDPTDPFSRGAVPYVIDVPTSVAGPIEGPGSFTVSLAHTYLGAPNPLSPAADIDIFVVVVDDDFSVAAAGAQVDGPLAGQPVFEPGRSEFRRVTISNPGIGNTPIVVDTTPQVPRLIFPQQEEGGFFLETSSAGQGGVQTTDLRTAVGDTKSATDRFLELRVVDPASGELSEGYRLKPEVLNDLPGLFKTLPDNRYAIYLVRTETNTRRLVIEVYVRNGKLIDPGDDSEGTRDRPPTEEATETLPKEATEAPRLEVEPEDSPILQPAQSDVSAAEAPANSPLATLAGTAVETMAVNSSLRAANTVRPAATFLGTAAVSLAASKSARSWAERVEQAVATAKPQQWHGLRRRRPNNRK